MNEIIAIHTFQKKESVHKPKLWNMNFWVDSTTTNVNRAWKWNSTCLVTFHCQKTILRCPATCANADQQWKDIETKLTKSTATLTAPHCTCIPDQQADFSSLTHLPSVFSTLVRDTAQNSQPWNKHGMVTSQWNIQGNKNNYNNKTRQDFHLAVLAKPLFPPFHQSLNMTESTTHRGTFSWHKFTTGYSNFTCQNTKSQVSVIS